ncbi:hypothetical protein UFOVP1301_64 [uncultured Caudovirales phage]|uniref:Uncharacterized protein n=1 Tax=uncultured Caudovirales phage TaxID=2100421 RepID=A0A6J5PB21_9CAUD|nr:hypothetical protein UFOVP663_49 [uncultured Caudovirales phage]CAB4168673.1 hypothetical protein UFOVP894_25 [uncultured Caudovirales phage]CAB4180885.1 hypothetical protein UFOVP1069_3 [uncultured Caudovirales phage]CAB4196220.1 hypothetical protein UFOVP1301_64 [uncultured Caudovirales phage]CAB4210852.1 hypothetical protein UFOVP1415_50 [uncultured Caudovirales phage]
MSYLSSLNIHPVVKIEIASSRGTTSVDTPYTITKIKLVLDDGSYMEVVATAADGKAIPVRMGDAT